MEFHHSICKHRIGRSYLHSRNCQLDKGYFSELGSRHYRVHMLSYSCCLIHRHFWRGYISVSNSFRCMLERQQLLPSNNFYNNKCNFLETSTLRRYIDFLDIPIDPGLGSIREDRKQSKSFFIIYYIILKIKQII